MFLNQGNSKSNKMDKRKNMNKKKHKTVNLKRAVLLFLLYTLTFITVFFFLDMYALFIYNPFFLSALSVVFGGLVTYVHLKKGERSRFDDIIDKLE